MGILEQIRKGNTVEYRPGEFSLEMLTETISEMFYGKYRWQEIKEEKEREEYYEIGGTWIKKTKIE